LDAGAADLYRLQAASFVDAVAGRDRLLDSACGLADAAKVCAVLETLSAAPPLAER
jgi:hypothetical protein